MLQFVEKGRNFQLSANMSCDLLRHAVISNNSQNPIVVLHCCILGIRKFVMISKSVSCDLLHHTVISNNCQNPIVALLPCIVAFWAFANFQLSAANQCYLSYCTTCLYPAITTHIVILYNCIMHIAH